MDINQIVNGAGAVITGGLILWLTDILKRETTKRRKK